MKEIQTVENYTPVASNVELGFPELWEGIHRASLNSPLVVMTYYPRLGKFSSNYRTLRAHVNYNSYDIIFTCTRPGNRNKRFIVTIPSSCHLLSMSPCKGMRVKVKRGEAAVVVRDLVIQQIEGLGNVLALVIYEE